MPTCREVKWCCFLSADPSRYILSERDFLGLTHSLIQQIFSMSLCGPSIALDTAGKIMNKIQFLLLRFFGYRMCVFICRGRGLWTDAFKHKLPYRFTEQDGTYHMYTCTWMTVYAVMGRSRILREHMKSLILPGGGWERLPKVICEQLCILIQPTNLYWAFKARQEGSIIISVFQIKSI